MSADHQANAEALDIALYGKPDVYTPPEAFMPRRKSIAEELARLYPAQAVTGHAAEADAAAAAGQYEIAQYHATRLLAEQQRLANLIAVAVRNDDALSAGSYRVSAGMAASFEDQLARVDAWFAEIREGLGLS